MSDSNQLPIIPNTATATKKDLADAYKTMLKKYQELENVGGARENAPTAEEKSNREVNQKFTKTSDVFGALQQTRTAVNTALAELEKGLAKKFAEFKRMQEAATFQEQKLKESYDIERAAGSLKALLRAEEEVQARQEEEGHVITTQRKREEEEYQFNRELQKRKDKEAYEFEKRKLEEELDARKKQAQAREAELAKQEAELQNLRKQVADFEATLGRALAKQKQEVEATLGKEKDTALELQRKDADAQKLVFEGQVKNLQVLLDEQREVIKRQEQQLQTAQKQVQEVVLKSIEGASNSKAFEVMNKFVSDTPSKQHHQGNQQERFQNRDGQGR